MGFGTGNLGMGITFTLDNQASAPAKAAGSSIRNLSNTVNTAGQQINKSASMITTGLVGVTLVVGALMAPFIGVTSAAADFGSVMSELSAKANLEKNSLEMAEMRAQAIALGDATKFSAIEVGEGQTFLAMAGFNSNKILRSMPGLLSLAAAGNLGLARASDIASNTMAQFNLDASDMAHISDVIANAAVNSNQSVEQFAQGMKFLGPTASALSIDLEEAASTMMLLANAGLQSSLGTRALGTSLASRLTGVIPKAADEMRRIGLDVFDAHGKFIGLEKTIRLLTKTTQNFTQQQRLQSIVRIFGAESIQEVTTLMNAEIEVMREGERVILKGADAMAYFTEQNKNAAGAAELMAKKMLDNLAGDMVKFKSVMETTAIVAGGSLAEALRPVVQLATDFLKVIKGFLGTNFGQWFIKVAAGVAALASGMIILTFVVSILTPAIWGMITAAGTLLITLAPFIAIAAVIAGAVVFMTKSFNMFTDVLAGAEAKTGFFGFMQKLGAVMQAGVMIWRSWNGETFALTENMHAALEKIGMLDLVLTMGTYIIRIKEFFTGFIDGARGVGTIVGEIWDHMKGGVNALFDTLTSLGIPLGKLNSDLTTFQEVGKIFGFVITAFIVKPLGIVMLLVDGLSRSISFLVELFRDLIGLTTAFFGGGGGISGVAQVLGKVGLNLAEQENVGNMVTLADEQEAGPLSNLIGNLIAEKLAVQGAGAATSTIINPPVTNLGDINLNVDLDGESIWKEMIPHEQLNDNRD